MFMFPWFVPVIIVIVAGSSVPSTSLSFVSISIHMIVSSFVVAISSFAVGGIFFSSSIPIFTEGLGSIVNNL